MEMVAKKSKFWLKPPRHFCKRMNDAKLRHLGNNILQLGMLNPIECLPDGEIISGLHRWLAVMPLDAIDDVPVRIISDPITDKKIRIRRLSENLQRSDLSFHDKYLECREFKKDEPDITSKELAVLLDVDASTITRYVCLDDCIEAVQLAAMERRIGMKACYEIAKEPAERQAELLEEALAGGAKQVTKARRKPTGTVPGAKSSKIKVVLASGVVITIGGGESLSLEDAIAELSEALSEMRKAEKQGLDAKTFMAVCRDRAKAGV
jgi:ParB-like chromosome segregation protein Spo0J